MGKCLTYIKTAKLQWDRPTLDVSTAVEIFHRLQIDLLSELKAKKFLRLAEERQHLSTMAIYLGKTLLRHSVQLARILRRLAIAWRPNAILPLFSI
jgi:hypothetical protein